MLPRVTRGAGRLPLPSHVVTKQSMQSYTNIRFSTDCDFLSFLIVVYRVRVGWTVVEAQNYILLHTKCPGSTK